MVGVWRFREYARFWHTIASGAWLEGITKPTEFGVWGLGFKSGLWLYYGYLLSLFLLLFSCRSTWTLVITSGFWTSL